jgi:hypothetical protein
MVGVIFVILAIGSLLTPDTVHGLVIGVPIFAVSIVKILAVIVGLLAVPLAGLIQLMRNNIKLTFYITAGVLLLLSFVMGAVYVFFTAKQTVPDGLVHVTQMGLFVAFVQIVASTILAVGIALSVPILALVLAFNQIYHKNISRIKATGIWVLLLLVVSIIIGSGIVIVSALKRGYLFVV